MAPGDEGRTAVDAAAAATGATAVVAWIEAAFGGPVTRVERLARWRAGWFVDVERDGEVLELYVRGERGPDFPSPFPLEHEVAVHRLLEDHGFPVPHVYGVVETGEGRALVMDRVPGTQGLMDEPDEATRARLMLTCVDLMARMHRIDLGELADRGFEVPHDPDGIVWSAAIARLEERYLHAGLGIDPVIEFLRLWLRRNRPEGRTRAAFVTWDAAQFLHHRGELTALIDFELAHVGDPYMDLAPLRSRDTMEPFGDLRGAFDRYAEVTGEPVDFDVVRWFEVAQLTATLLLQHPVLAAPHPDSDLVTHIVWYVESGRYACDVLAELLHVELTTVPPIEATPSPAAAAHAHLVESLRTASRAPAGAVTDPIESARRWRARCDHRLARHLQRVDEIGAAAADQDRAEVEVLVGRRVRDARDADDALVELVRREDPALDVDLLRYIDRRLQRRSMQLGPPDALLVRHVPLQPLPDRAGS